MLKVASIIRNNKEEYARTIALEMGKLLTEARADYRVSGDKHSENRNLPDNYVTRRLIEQSHNLFFYNAFNTVEAKRPVQNIYKRPI